VNKVHVDNPPLAPALRAVLWLTVPILLSAGLSLFFIPDLARPQWPWDIGPFNAAFLGGFYLAAGVGIALAATEGRWYPARVLLPMVFVFTGSLMLVTLLDLGRFVFTRWTTYGWFIIYLLLPSIAALALWRYREFPSPEAYVTPPGWRSLLLLFALAFLTYGVALFLFPSVVGAHWPWPLDPFHAQAYSAVFTAAAVGALGLTQWAAPSERLVVGAAFSLLGLFAIAGTLIVDAGRHSVAWGRPGVWLWLGLLGLLFGLGLALVAWSAVGRQPAPGSRR
jgi:hypothetical protein